MRRVMRTKEKDALGGATAVNKWGERGYKGGAIRRTKGEKKGF